MNSSGTCGITRRIEEMQHVLLIIVMLKKKMDYVHQTYQKKTIIVQKML
jgi:hypothetical protein